MVSYSHDAVEWSNDKYGVDTPASEFGNFEPIVKLWNSKRIHSKFPAWKDFELEDFAGWYGWISVADISDDEVFDITFRLWGTKVAELLGCDLTGKSPRNASETLVFESGYDQDEIDLLESLAKQPAILLSVGSVHWQRRSHIRYEEIAFPLADDGETVNKLLFVTNSLT